MGIRSIIRWGCGVCVVLCGVVFVGGTRAADAGAAARLAGAARRQASGGWLQLEQDQQAVRRQAEPMTPRALPGLQIRKQQERLRLRATLQDQQREVDAHARSRRWAADPAARPPGEGARALGLQLRHGRELDALRLRQGLNPRLEGPPPGWPGQR